MKRLHVYLYGLKPTEQIDFQLLDTLSNYSIPGVHPWDATQITVFHKPYSEVGKVVQGPVGGVVLGILVLTPNATDQDKKTIASAMLHGMPTVFVLQTRVPDPDNPKVVSIKWEIPQLVSDLATIILRVKLPVRKGRA